MRFRIALIVACAAVAVPVAAQTTALSRADAVQTAVNRGARLGAAQADTALASAQLLAARALPNPTASYNYSKDTPHNHVLMTIPIDFPYLRSLRVRSAQLGVDAAALKYEFVRATIALDADTTYTRAIAARERVVLSRRTALDADSLLHMVERRRDAGDASGMDVELARVNAGQQANIAASDSLTWISALLDLQAALGMPGQQLMISATDSLSAPPETPPLPAVTLNEAAASKSLESATLAARLQHRSIWSSPSVNIGFDQGDPGNTNALLPTYGVSIGLPLFDRNRGAIAQAEAERLRARAELTLAQVEARNQIAHSTRERENALAKVARDRVLITSADRVVSMSLTAYREGASALPNVLEAQRTAREVLAQYIDDLANAWVATAELRVLGLTPERSTQP
ncbi:MAG TPA: TolC family protein [Gemmatimonadaceae bacterium]